ncbi:MAG: hypothetical protein H0U10_11615 [Chloroflexia bacterium]|nr:hypothetical protein [Chloroflexia bacterium]
MIAALRDPKPSSRAALALAALAVFAVPLAATGAPTDPAPCADAEEAAFLVLINDYRRENGIEPLGLSRTLTLAAEFHSADMATTGFFDHTLGDGTTVEQNIASYGYAGSTYGENIAAGTDTAESAVQTWQASPTHNQNMLRSAYGAIGIGHAQDSGSGYGWYWTTIFGGEFDEPAMICGESGGQAVTLDDVNLRRGPGPQHAIELAVPAGVELPVAGESVAGYIPVEYDGETLWIALDYVAVDGVLQSSPPAVAAPDPLPTFTPTVNLLAVPDPAPAASGDLAGATATATEPLNLRAGPSREAGILTVVAAGSEMLLTGNRESGYFEVQFGNLVAWADAAYLRS